MSFLLSSDLNEFAGVFRKFLETEVDSKKLRSAILEETGAITWAVDTGLWTKVVELGVLLAPVPESLGGLDFGFLSEFAVLEETGRALLPLPLFETLSVTELLRSSTTLNEAGTALLTKAVQGTPLSLSFDTAHWSETGSTCSLKKKAGGELVSGSLEFVASAESIETLVFLARRGKGKAPELFSVALAQSGVLVERTPTFDLLRSFSKISFSGVPVTSLGEGPKSFQTWRERFDVAAVAELCGVGAKALEMTVEYVKTRQQFGKPVGSFQAVQHKLADMLLKLEQAQSLGRFAAWCQDKDQSQATDAALAAKGFASESIPQLIEAAIQVHGGIGFTFEYDLHLYLRRALMLAQLISPAGDCYEELARRVVSA